MADSTRAMRRSIFERELLPNFALQVNYSYTKTDDLFGNFTGRITPRTGVALTDYAPGSGFTANQHGRLA